MSLLELLCEVDDFTLIFFEWLQQRGLGAGRSSRGGKARLSMSEVMTISIYFHQSHYRDFKAYYTQHVQKHLDM